MSRRGFDVEALPKPSSGYDPMDRGWRDAFAGQTWEKNLGNRNKTVEKNINNQMASWGDGARGVVYVKWKGERSAHVFNVEQKNGKTLAYDGQNGKRFFLMDYLKDSEPTKTMLSRVDNLQTPNAWMSAAMKQRGK